MAITRIPVANEASQDFKIDLTGEDFIIDLTFNKLDNLWRIKLSDSDENVIFSGRPILLGVSLFAATKIKGLLFAIDST